MAELDAAMAGHPRIGDRGPELGEQSAREQSGIGNDPAVLAELRYANAAYERRFGHVYLVCASVRGPAEILADLRGRMANDPETEREVAAAELGKINAIRLRALAESEGAESEGQSAGGRARGGRARGDREGR
jgi:2-oxo-4-hydroxy-4-carboxy-5-ureidoimidazoline decarboxylase